MTCWSLLPLLSFDFEEYYEGDNDILYANNVRKRSKLKITTRCYNIDGYYVWFVRVYGVSRESRADDFRMIFTIFMYRWYVYNVLLLGLCFTNFFLWAATWFDRNTVRGVFVCKREDLRDVNILNYQIYGYVGFDMFGD